MIEKLRLWIAPAYLLLCLLLGGSAQGIWANAILQLIAIVIIAWAVLERCPEHLPRPARQLFGLIALALSAVAVQLIPLPPALWRALPGRQFVYDGYVLLGLSPGWMPLSLAPYDTVGMLLSLLPPIAVLAAILVLRSRSAQGLALTVVMGTVAGVLLGVLQVTSGGPTSSPWYLFKNGNFGVATGFFANGNHMALLLLIAIPLIAALGSAAAEVSKDARKRYATLALMAGALAVVLVGLVLNGSLSGYGLLLPVTAASILIVVRQNRWIKRSAVGVTIVGVVALAAVMFSPLGDRVPSAGAATSVSTRQEMAARSLDAVGAFFPVGSGLGTFPKVYRLFEDPASIDRTYVNHAHNDYLELAVEMGVAGIALIILFLLWWAVAVRRVIRSPATDQYAIAAAIASAAVLLHSLVDYPLRTAAISASFAACLALMLIPRRSAKSETDFRSTRHLVID